MIKTPRLAKNRHGVFYVRAVFFAKNTQRKVKQISLKTKDPEKARILALEFNLSIQHAKGQGMAIHDDDFRKIGSFSKNNSFTNSSPSILSDSLHGLKVFADGSIDFDSSNAADLAFVAKHLEKTQRFQSLAPNNTAVVYQKSPLFSELLEPYALQKKGENSPKTIDEKISTFTKFIDVLGDQEINAYTKQHFSTYKTRELATLTPATVNKRISQLKDFFTWALNNGMFTAGANPLEKMGFSKKAIQPKQEDIRLNFSPTNMRKIFGEKYIETMYKPDFYWIPLIAMFSGARLEEIGSLKTEGFQVVDGVDCFFVEEGKNASARRFVPVHSMLIKLGLLDYVNLVKNKQQTHIFYERFNEMGTAASERFNDVYLKKTLGIYAPVVFHCTRHTVCTMMDKCKISDNNACQIVGHESGAKQNVHSTVYNHNLTTLPELKKSLEKLVYEDLDFLTLKLADPCFTGYYNKRDADIFKKILNVKHLQPQSKWAKKNAKNATAASNSERQ
jgi:integrase